MRPSLLLALALSLTLPALAGAEGLPEGIHGVDAEGVLLSPALSKAPRRGARLAIVVHGINPVHTDLDPLCRDLRARQFEVLRFVYNSRSDLDHSSLVFRRALLSIRRDLRPSRLAVVAHSMGGLVSRRALSALTLTPPQRTKLRRVRRGKEWSTRRVPIGPAPVGLPALQGPVSFVTIASPFGGFRSANWARFDFGLGRPVFRDLGTRSGFIAKPGALAAGVAHTKVETDEAGHRRHDGGSDLSVALKSQVQPKVDASAQERIRLDLGHVGSIRDEGLQVPTEVQAILARVVGPKVRGSAERRRGLVAPLQGKRR